MTSALGCLLADVRYDDTWSVHRRVDEVDADQIRRLYQRMVERVMAVMADDGIERGAVALTYEAALQYEGQTHRVVIDAGAPAVSGAELRRRFEEGYRKLYDVAVTDAPVRLINLRLRAAAPRTGKVGIKIPVPDSGGVDRAPSARGRMMIDGRWVEAAIFTRWKLPRGIALDGPARIDQADTTTLVPPGWAACIDTHGNIEINRPAE